MQGRGRRLTGAVLALSALLGAAVLSGQGTTMVSGVGWVLDAAGVRFDRPVGIGTTPVAGYPLLIQAGAGTAVKVPVGAVTVNVTEAGNIANTNEQDLWTYSLPAATLNANGRGVRITVWGTLAANANDKMVKLYMGGYLLSSSVIAMRVNNGLFRAQAEVIRTGAATEVGNASFYYGVLNGAQIYRANAFALALDTTAAIIIKVAGQSPTAGAANDVVFKGALVEVF